MWCLGNAASVKIQYQPQPMPKAIVALAGANITAFAAGQNHCIAVDDSGAAYTWGNGGAPSVRVTAVVQGLLLCRMQQCNLPPLQQRHHLLVALPLTQLICERGLWVSLVEFVASSAGKGCWRVGGRRVWARRPQGAGGCFHAHQA